jgi:hypothetical protein
MITFASVTDRSNDAYISSSAVNCDSDNDSMSSPIIHMIPTSEDEVVGRQAIGDSY